MAPKVDEDDDDTYLCQVCGKRDTSECSTCDLYLCCIFMCSLQASALAEKSAIIGQSENSIFPVGQFG